MTTSGPTGYLPLLRFFSQHRFHINADHSALTCGEMTPVEILRDHVLGPENPPLSRSLSRSISGRGSLLFGHLVEEVRVGFPYFIEPILESFA